MFTFIKIALRNIIRNKRRSLITVSAVGFGLGALIFIWSFVDGAHIQMIENYTSLLTGHIQIHSRGFNQREQLEINISNPQEIINIIEDESPLVEASPRIKAFGLISSPEYSSGIIILGVDPLQEIKVSSLHKRLKSGEFLDEAESNEIVIGESLARNLNVSLGDKVVIMSQAFDGSIAAGAYYVKGVLDTGAEEIDKSVVLIAYDAAQELFVMPDRASEIVLRLENVENSPAEALKFRQLLSGKGLEVLPWQEISPILKQWIEFDNGFIWIIVMVVMIVVAIGILNTVLMGVLERTREFGILLSIGTRRRQIITTVAWESLFLGVIGSLIGLCIGYFLSVYFGTAGIDLSVFTQALSSFYMEAVIYPRLSLGHLLTSMALVLFTSIIVSVYPAWHAANLKPVEAIRSI
ncbi:MAG: hypothetical protein COV72_02820 [Candidatus Omnitrophica bacterium CG11_big_fil_rev_8_21_14_0_20_42_13]|uniref:ABC transporter permease n=1 Tax=Candidatus Ghiorseimicrobium undicola TaxID=1974746 RepID=A0A2H0M150_9BACT|nr:MAG: hypothetical protein COV72_02820 [Candidatus Omnitrophica bacterium CG11_big_fil_rev_8_21_14_0_20_42_13]